MRRELFIASILVMGLAMQSRRSKRRQLFRGHPTSSLRWRP